MSTTIEGADREMIAQQNQRIHYLFRCVTTHIPASIDMLNLRSNNNRIVVSCGELYRPKKRNLS